MGDWVVSQWLRGAGGQTLTASSCRMCSMVASSARVPLVASSSTALTVFKSDVTLVTITCRQQPESCSRTSRPSPVSLAWCSTSPPPRHDPQAGTVLRPSGLTLAEFFSWYTAGSSPDLPAAALVAPIRSPRALATSLTALIRTTWVQRRAA